MTMTNIANNRSLPPSLLLSFSLFFSLPLSPSLRCGQQLLIVPWQRSRQLDILDTSS